MRSSFLARQIFKVIKRSAENSSIIFKVVFPDGSALQNIVGDPVITLKVKHWSTFFKTAFLGSYAVAVDFINSKIDIDGDLRYLGGLAHSSTGAHLDRTLKAQKHPGTIFEYVLNKWHMLRHLAWSYEQARYNAEFHYGHDPEFYFNYLGPTGAYSTGIWYPDTKNVDESQENKWEFILRKARLSPGMRVCSTGSGFGYGEMLAAEKYGVIVDCYNTCRPQVKWLREEVKRRYLDGKVNVYLADQREIRHKKNFYDRILSIEHIEHAGDLFRRQFVKYMLECLKDDGIGIVQYLSYPIRSDVALFIRKYLYPAVTMPPLGEMLDDIVRAGGEVQDVLCNRRHYYYTLNAWYENFLRNADKIRAINPRKYDEKFIRTWSMYLASGSYYLVVNNATANLFQITFTKGDSDTYPMNRDFLYDDSVDDSAWVEPAQWAEVYRDRELDGFGSTAPPHVRT